MEEENYFGVDDENINDALQKTKDEYDEDLMGDEEDRKFLNSLPELEREKILNQRHSKREENKKKKELLEKLNRERGANLLGKGNLADLKRERDRRTNRNDQFIDDEDDEEYDEYDDGDEDYEEFRDYKKRKPRTGSDSDYEDPEMAKPKKKLKRKQIEGDVKKDRVIDSTKEDLDLIQKICLKRNFLLKMSPHLFFKKTVEGCLVKTTYKIASDKIDYRIGKIIDVIEKDETYEVDTQAGAKKLNKYLIVKIGNEDKEFQFVFISNKSMEERELHNWLKELEEYELPKPTVFEVEKKEKEVMEIINSKYKAKDIKEMVKIKRENRYKNLTDPFEKKRFLENMIQEEERKYFEKASHEGKRKLENLKSELRAICRKLKKTKRSRKASPEKYYNVKKNKSELYGFSQGKKIGGDIDMKSNIHARTIAAPVNMWSIKQKELDIALEDQKKRFENVNKKNNNEDSDPHKALYNRNLAIKNDFLSKFQRDLRIDDKINQLVVSIDL